jgi:hypothetical protein
MPDVRQERTPTLRRWRAHPTSSGRLRWVAADSPIRADEVLDVRVVLDPPRRPAVILVLSIIAPFLRAGDWTNLVSNQQFVVLVVRTSDGQAIARYPHPRQWHADFQAESLRARLRTSDVDHMAAHLGVARSRVLNPLEDKGA